MISGAHSIDPMDFGDFLRQFRARESMTMLELAKKIGVSQQTVLKWEKKESFPKNAMTLKKLATRLQVPLQEFMRLKDLRRIRLREEKISSLKEPVISASWLNYVPFLGADARELPLESIAHPAHWTGKRYFLPGDLFSGYLFAFEISDKGMEPGYSAGDVVLADLRKPLQDGYPVVIKTRNRAPLCRIYAKRSSRVILSPADSIMPVIEVKTNEVEWCHGVIRHFRQLR